MTTPITLTGKDKRDLDKQEWDWRSDNPRAIIRKVYPPQRNLASQDDSPPPRAKTAPCGPSSLKTN